MSEPTILICIGAPKAGTTWLYDYLVDHPDCHFRAVKELHYFDTLDGRDAGFHANRLDLRAQKIRRRLRGTLPWRHKALRRDLRDVEEWLATGRNRVEGDHSAYLNYLGKGRGDKRLVGDITPCYATLGRERFAEMAALGADVRFVYLLRDPLDRAWSQARMNGRRNSKRLNRPVERVVRRQFDSFIRGAHTGFLARSDYARTLTELSAAVPQEKIHVAFFEEMFQQDALDRLTDFLGISRHAGDFRHVAHQGQPMKIDDKRRASALAFLAEQYAFCKSYFDGQLPDRWQAHMAEI